MITYIMIAIIWFALGYIAFMACLADLYDIGEDFPSLGSAQEQWEEDGRADALPVALAMFLLGLFGFIAVAFATGLFKTGFRRW